MHQSSLRDRGVVHLHLENKQWQYFATHLLLILVHVQLVIYDLAMRQCFKSIRVTNTHPRELKATYLYVVYWRFNLPVNSINNEFEGKKSMA